MTTISGGMIFLIVLVAILAWALAYGLIFFLCYLCRDKNNEKEEKEQ